MRIFHKLPPGPDSPAKRTTVSPADQNALLTEVQMLRQDLEARLTRAENRLTQVEAHLYVQRRADSRPANEGK